MLSSVRLTYDARRARHPIPGVDVAEQDLQASGGDLANQLKAAQCRLQVEVETRDVETTDLYRQLAHLRSQVEELGRALATGQSGPADGSLVGPGCDGPEVGRGATLGLLRIMGVTGTPLRRSLVDRLHEEGLIATTDPRSGGARRPFSQLQQKGLIEAVIVSRESGGHPVHLFRLTPVGQDLYRRM